MALTAAEKQRRYRERLKKNPEKYEESKRKLREHYHKNKRLTGDLSTKEKYNARMIWKLRKRNQRQRAKLLANVINETPAGSSSLPPIANEYAALRAQESNSPTPSSPNTPDTRRGRKAVRRDRTKLYKANKKLLSENEKLRVKYEKYKKRYQRLINKKQEKDNQDSDKENRKYKILTSALSDRYKNTKKNNDKRILKRIFANPTVKSSNLRSQLLKDSLNMSGAMRFNIKSKDSETELQTKIQKFFVRDDVSRNTAGKNETVTKAKEKRQKRYLLDSMKNLYKTFKQENLDVTCSYFYFTRNRPWHIKSPSIDGREMCLCKIHANTMFKANALQSKQVLKTKEISQIISNTVCESTIKDCMYGLCLICAEKKTSYNETKMEDKVSFYAWTRKEEKYTKDGKDARAIKNVKEKKEVLVKDLIKDFEKELIVLKKHVFNMKTQYKNFRRCIDELELNEVVILADFSENYNCKHSEEIQAHHFGGSRQQLSLHTVMVYTRDQHKNIHAQSYCTVSSCNLHQPAAIWAHFHPILQKIKTNFPAINTLHFFSDGPFTQYRQKQNFYLACTKPYEYGFEAVTWSFFETGHGKGPADGIGGYLKRTADRIVARGQDIANVKQFTDALKGISKVELFIVTKEDIDHVQEHLPKNIERLHGTLQMHQIFTAKYGEFKHRILSCFCKRGFCECMDPKVYRPVRVREPIEHLSPASSEDEVPLIRYKSTQPNSELPLDIISYTDLASHGTRRNMYDIVYGSDDTEDAENQPSCSNKNNKPRHGDFLLVKVHGGKNKMYTYACKAITDIEDDGEIKVMFLRAVKSASKFILDEKDIAYVAFDDIVKNLPEPKRLNKNDLIYYEFEEPLDVFEK